MASSSRRMPAGTQNILVIGITFVLGMSLGALSLFVIQNISQQNDLETQELTQSDAHQSSTKHTGDASPTSVIAVGKFQEIFKHRSIADQYTALYTALSRSTEQDLKEWWAQSQQIEQKSHRETAQNAILSRLTTINPQEALSYIEEVSIFETDALLNTVYSEWSISALDSAIEAIANLSSSQRDIAVEAILKTRDDLSDSERRSIAIQLGNEEKYLKLDSDTKASQSIAEPKESWDTLLNDSVDDSLQVQSLAKIAEAWHAQIGFEVLSHILVIAPENRAALFRSIVQLDLVGAMDYASGVEDESQKQSLVMTIGREWARTDAPAALSAVSSIQPPTLASRLESLIATTWAFTKPKAVIENVELISEEFRIDTLESAFSMLAGKDPKGAIEKLSSVEHYVGNTSSIVRRIVYRWSDQEPDTAADWVLNTYPKEDPQRRTLLEPILRSLVHQDPSKAFEIAIAQPAPSEGFGLEVTVMQGITRDGDIELAKKLLPQVRGENSKTYVYSLIGGAMVKESKFDEALNFGQELGESEQTQYYRLVLDDWAEKDPKNLLASIESLPSDSIKSSAAFQLVFNNEYTPVLTDDQIEHAKTFLNSDDKARLKRIEDM